MVPSDFIKFDIPTLLCKTVSQLKASIKGFSDISKTSKLLLYSTLFWKTGKFAMFSIKTNSHVDTIVMPENLRVGLLVNEYREKCKKGGCTFDYAGFAFGQSPFHVPPPLVKALAEQADKGYYSPAEGITILREAIAGFNKRHFNLDVDISRIVVGPGTKSLIFSIFSMITGTVIIPSPSWIGYYPQLRLLGRPYRTFKLLPEFNYKVDPIRLEELLKKMIHLEKQHLLIINNPHNPTGALYSKDEITDIANVCRRNNTLVLADEIYSLTTYNFSEFTSMGAIYPEGTFVTNGLSKDRSAGGYRLGTCILPDQGSDKLKTEFTKIAVTVYTNVSTPTQYASVVVYEPNEEVEEYISITRNINRMMGFYMSDEFNKIEGIKCTKPSGTFYFYADFNLLRGKLKEKGVITSNDLGRSLLSHPHHIATTTGDAIMLDPDDYGARIAFVDYDGKSAFKRYQKDPPKNQAEERKFVNECAPKMIDGIEMLKEYVNTLNV
jgi:aspartate aminotransferase